MVREEVISGVLGFSRRAELEASSQQCQFPVSAALFNTSTHTIHQSAGLVYFTRQVWNSTDAQLLDKEISAPSHASASLFYSSIPLTDVANIVLVQVYFCFHVIIIVNATSRDVLVW